MSGSAPYQAANSSQFTAPTSPSKLSKAPPPVSASPSYAAANSSVFGHGRTTAFSGTMPQYQNASQSTFPACQPVSGYDAESCSCVTRVNSWYEAHATATTTPIVCQYSMAKGYVYSFTPGCFPQTSTMLAEPYVAPDECCSGPCRIRAEGVRLVYWAPEDGPATNSTNTTIPANLTSNITLAPRVPEEPYTLVEDGFTFTSPSVYVIYSSISASQSCVARFDSSVLRGFTHYVTRAYAPEALSTANCGVSAWQPGAWSAINYNELYYPPTWPEIHNKFDACRSGQPEIGYDFASHQIANPQLSFPPDVTQIDPAWSTCSGIYLGAQDPPRVLTKVSGAGQVTIDRPHPKPAMVHTKVPEPAASAINDQPPETIGVILHPTFHNSVHNFLPKASSTQDSIPKATVKPAVFITGLPDTTKPNSAQAAGSPQWSLVTLTPFSHSTVAAIAPQGPPAAIHTYAVSQNGVISPQRSSIAEPSDPSPIPAVGSGEQPALPEVGDFRTMFSILLSVDFRSS